MRHTIAEALRDMHRLHDVDAGRLRGQTVYLSGYTADQPAPTAPQPWADHLATLIAGGRAGSITADTPRYLVYSDLCRGRHKSDYAETPVMPRPYPDSDP